MHQEMITQFPKQNFVGHAAGREEKEGRDGTRI